MNFVPLKAPFEILVLFNLKLVNQTSNKIDSRIGIGRFTDALVHHGIYFDDIWIDTFTINTPT